MASRVNRGRNLGRVDANVFNAVGCLTRKGFVDLIDVNIIHGDASLFQQSLERG